MLILGLIVEYNPLHNGHIYHIKKSKELIQPDIIIAVMSGHFTQRGEPTITSKWNRTKLALDSGIDIVIELPYIYSNQSADLFAYGAIAILKEMRATHIIFGSEIGEMRLLQQQANIIDEPNFQTDIAPYLKQGYSLPHAIASLYPDMQGSNNTLGVHYIRAIKKLGANIIPMTIKRTANDYNDEVATHQSIASATTVRTLMNENQNYQQFVPQIINDEYSNLQNWEHHYPFLRQKLLTSSPKFLSRIHDMKEGLENRLMKAAITSSTWTDFMNEVSTKRYTKTRIQRICANILTGLTKELMVEFDSLNGPGYIRVLGFSNQGSLYLKGLKKVASVPIYSNFSRLAPSSLKFELQVTAAFASVYPKDIMTDLIKQEYQQIPIRRCEL